MLDAISSERLDGLPRNPHEDTPEAREEAAFWEAATADTWDGLE